MLRLCCAKGRKETLRRQDDARRSPEAQDRSLEQLETSLDDSIVLNTTREGDSGPTQRKQYLNKGEQAASKRTREEAMPTPRTPAVEFVGMTKRFGSFTAVDDLSLSLHKDEIFCFLGHNGAGKTTSLNVLMGKVSPSLGTVKLSFESKVGRNHHETSESVLDIRDDAQQAQSLMGTCSQHDTLFETLSVEQHIYLFYKLKESLVGRGFWQGQRPIEQRVDELIKTVQLEPHRHKESQNLSGGMRRRLSIALALVSPSESSIVILDEPTTGLDAMVREDVWQLIKKLRQNRCIVMTTQHLQEAEELAD